jgi:hypothetical protein
VNLQDTIGGLGRSQAAEKTHKAFTDLLAAAADLLDRYQRAYALAKVKQLVELRTRLTAAGLVDDARKLDGQITEWMNRAIPTGNDG